MLSKKLQQDIRIHCYAWVSTMFATMHNPRLRGPAFKWEEFPDMMEEQCALFYNTDKPVSKRVAKQVLKEAAIFGRQFAEQLLKTMTE